MQDRFKFRIWDKEQNKYFSFEDFKRFDVEFNFDPTTNEVVCEYDKNRYIVLSSTGLKDKNGKLIYEGDIVKAITHNPYEKHIGVIHFHTCYFSLDYINFGKYGEAGISLAKNTEDFVSLKIIGNIYENPELLEEANNDN